MNEFYMIHSPIGGELKLLSFRYTNGSDETFFNKTLGKVLYEEGSLSVQKLLYFLFVMRILCSI